MPYYDEIHESKANRHTDSLGFGEIGGVGQLIYHHVRFSNYECLNMRDPELPVRPVINKKSPPELSPEDDMTGRELLTSLCDLARRIDSFDETTSHYTLIMEWCISHMHPYHIDYLYNAISEAGPDITPLEAKLLANDAAFTIAQFMKDLEMLYNAARFYVALDDLCRLENDTAYNLYQEGRHFEAPAVFEEYKHNNEFPDIDVSPAGGDILKEMELYSQAPENERPPEGEFYTEPYDDYELLRDKLIEYIPDFRLRLKLNPTTNTLVFSADVDSVFDIAWYTLARMLSEEPPLEKKGALPERPEGIMICCLHCGRFFIRKTRHQQYCSSKECQNARNAKNQRKHRRRQSDKKVKSAIGGKKTSPET